ncbi:MAG: FIST C-terminal domain-containing protein [Phycisphaeraceae bacterium]|nr:FIST C-terminal domain-containing protein [Phycisphaeraceae bacterium]
MHVSTPDTQPKLAAGMSADADTIDAAKRACAQCAEGLESPADLACVFFSPHHLTSISDLAATVQRTLGPRTLVGVSAEGVIAGDIELERAPGVSILAFHLPGVEVRPYATEQFPVLDETPESLFMLRDVVGAGEDLRCIMMFIEPFSTPFSRVLTHLNRATAGGGGGPIVGGLASASGTAGGNALFLNDRIIKTGGVGVSLRGPLRVDCLVSQGCRPFGPPMVVTKAQGNAILELGGVRAVDAIQMVLQDQGESRHKLLAGGLFIGKAPAVRHDAYGRDDFLMRKALSIRAEEGSVITGDAVHVGQTIRLHARDAAAADLDLSMLLDKQKLYDKPRGAMLVASHGRGRRLFKQSHHDARAVTRSFRQAASGEQLAKPGIPYYTADQTPAVPVAGFFAAGEIAPIRGESFVQTQSACLTLFRSADPAQGH